MFQIFHLSIVYLSLILNNFSRNLFLEMCEKHILFLDTHNRFDKSQYDKKVSSCTFESFVFRFESMLKLTRVIFEDPSPSNRNKLLMWVVGTPFKLLFSSWSGKFWSYFLRALFTHFIHLVIRMNIVDTLFFIEMCGILMNWFKLNRLL